MKIVLTGGGTGGHFYPLIAVAEEVRSISKEKKLIDPEIYFFAPQSYDEGLLYEQGIRYVYTPAGKVRRYFSPLNIVDIFKTIFGVLKTLWSFFIIYPDVVFSKGGFGAFPTLFAARFFRVPVIVHESDTVPGKVNAWSGRFAFKVAVSYVEAANYFPIKKTAVLGNPIRKSVEYAAKDTGKDYYNIPANRKTILILGGSQGAKIINETILEALPELLKEYSVIHQVGKIHIDEMVHMSKVVVTSSQLLEHYKPFASLDPLHLKMAAGAADIIVTRAGSTLFEIASWQVPAIIIPITSSNGDHQRKNAYSYARTGGGIVVEENNLTSNVIVAEVQRILGNAVVYEQMIQGAKTFHKPDAAAKIAEALLAIGVSHETV